MKTGMNKVTTLSLAAALLLGSSAVWADPGHGRGHGRGHDRYAGYEHHRPRHAPPEYRYVYYPRHNVYYAPVERVWYVRNDYRWHPYYQPPRRLYGGVDVVLHVPLR